MCSENKEESADKEKSVDLSDMLPSEDDEEKVKEEKRFNILTPNKLLTRRPIFFVQIKGVNKHMN